MAFANVLGPTRGVQANGRQRAGGRSLMYAAGNLSRAPKPEDHEDYVFHTLGARALSARAAEIEYPTNRDTWPVIALSVTSDDHCTEQP